VHEEEEEKSSLFNTVRKRKIFAEEVLSCMRIKRLFVAFLMAITALPLTISEIT
jgi:hypothetical protein